MHAQQGTYVYQMPAHASWKHRILIQSIQMHACLLSQEQIHMHRCIKDMLAEEHVCTTWQMQCSCHVLECRSSCSLPCGLSLCSVLLLQTIVTLLLPTHPHLYFLYLIGWDDHMHNKAPISSTSHGTFNTPLHTCTFNFMQYIVTAAL